MDKVDETKYVAALVGIGWAYGDAVEEADLYNRGIDLGLHRPLHCYPHPDVRLVGNQLKNVATGQVLCTYNIALEEDG